MLVRYPRFSDLSLLPLVPLFHSVTKDKCVTGVASKANLHRGARNEPITTSLSVVAKTDRQHKGMHAGTASARSVMM